MLHPHEKLARLRKDYPDDWWITLPVSPELTLALAADAAFWRKHGRAHGWHGEETPFDAALSGVPQLRNTDVERHFAPERMKRQKVGGWCLYVCAVWLQGMS